MGVPYLPVFTAVVLAHLWLKQRFTRGPVYSSRQNARIPNPEVRCAVEVLLLTCVLHSATEMSLRHLRMMLQHLEGIDRGKEIFQHWIVHHSPDS
jgi:hypothetical protein